MNGLYPWLSDLEEEIDRAMAAVTRESHPFLWAALGEARVHISAAARSSRTPPSSFALARLVGEISAAKYLDPREAPAFARLRKRLEKALLQVVQPDETVD